MRVLMRQDHGTQMKRNEKEKHVAAYAEDKGEARGRDWSDMSRKQGMPRMTGNHQKPV